MTGWLVFPQISSHPRCSGWSHLMHWADKSIAPGVNLTIWWMTIPCSCSISLTRLDQAFEKTRSKFQVGGSQKVQTEFSLHGCCTASPHVCLLVHSIFVQYKWCSTLQHTWHSFLQKPSKAIMWISCRAFATCKIRNPRPTDEQIYRPSYSASLSQTVVEESSFILPWRSWKFPGCLVMSQEF